MINLHGLHIALNFLGFWVLFTFYGLLISKIWLVPSYAFYLPDLYSRWRQMLGECLVGLAFTGVMLLLVRTAEMDNGTLIKVLADLPVVLTQTHFGFVWALHLITLLLLWVCCAVFLSRSPSNIWTVFMVSGMLILAFTYSASSHASDNGDFTLAELNDWAHVISTSIWGGSIFISALLIFPLLQERHSLISIVAIRLSRLAGVALAFVLVTGMYNSSLQLRDLDALANTNYGRVLAIKLAIVGAVILIGALNRFVIISRIKQYAADNSCAVDKPLRLVFRALTADAAFVLLAIIMAAILIQNEAG
jgi:putative copper export protein